MYAVARISAAVVSNTWAAILMFAERLPHGKWSLHASIGLRRRILYLGLGLWLAVSVLGKESV